MDGDPLGGIRAFMTMPGQTVGVSLLRIATLPSSSPNSENASQRAACQSLSPVTHRGGDCRRAVRSIDAVPALQFANVPSDRFYLIQARIRLGRHVAEPPVMGPDAPADGERERDVGMVRGPVDRMDERWAGSVARPMESVALEAPPIIRSSPCFCCRR